MCAKVVRVFQGVSRCVQRLSGCFRVFPEVYRGFQGVSGCFKRFRKKTMTFFTFNLYYKTRHMLLQNAAALLDDPCITKRGKCYYKTRQVLQNAPIITKRSSNYSPDRNCMGGGCSNNN